MVSVRNKGRFLLSYNIVVYMYNLCSDEPDNCGRYNYDMSDFFFMLEIRFRCYDVESTSHSTQELSRSTESPGWVFYNIWSTYSHAGVDTWFRFRFQRGITDDW